MERKYWIYGVVGAVLLLGVFILPFSPLSIYYEHIHIGGKVQEYFDRCNPCKFYVVVDEEDRFLKNVKFDVSVNFRGMTGYDVKCWQISELNDLTGKRVCDQPCGPCYYSGDDICRMLGYKTAGCCEGGGCGGYPPPCPHEPGSCEKCCHRKHYENTQWVELRTSDNDVIWRGERGESNPAETVNISKYLNKECKDYIEAGEGECKVPFYAYSENNAGRYQLSNTPSKLEYCSKDAWIDAEGKCVEPPKGSLELLFRGILKKLGIIYRSFR